LNYSSANKYNHIEFLASFSSVYLAKKLSSKKKKFEIDIILEEGDSNKFDPTKIYAEAFNESKKIHDMDCYLFKIILNKIPADWWIAKDGQLCRMNVPSLGINLELAKEKEAKNSI